MSCNNFYQELDNQKFLKVINNYLTIIKSSKTEQKFDLSNINIPIEFYNTTTISLNSNSEFLTNLKMEDYKSDEVLFFDNLSQPLIPCLTPTSYISKTETINTFTSGDFDQSFNQSFALSRITILNNNFKFSKGDSIIIKDINDIILKTITITSFKVDGNMTIIYFDQYIPSNSFSIEIKVKILAIYTNFIKVDSNGQIFNNGEMITIRYDISNSGNYIITNIKPSDFGVKGIIIIPNFIESDTTFNDIFLWKFENEIGWNFGGNIQLLNSNFKNFNSNIIIKNPTNSVISFTILTYV